MTIIETPAPLTVTEKREALLYNMLSHTTHVLKRFLKHQQRRNTLQSLEAAEYIKQELQTATAWLQEFKCDTTMHDAFAALADELEAQIAQEVADVMTVWECIKENGGFLVRSGVRLHHPLNENGTINHEGGVFGIKGSPDWLHTAAEWVRKQGEP